MNLPLSPPKGGTKCDFAVLPVKFNFCRKKSATKFLCVKTSSKIKASTKAVWLWWRDCFQFLPFAVMQRVMRVCQRQVIYLLQLWHPRSYRQNGWSVSCQILCAGRMCEVLAVQWQTTPNVCDQGHVIRFFKFCPNHIFGIGEARHFKFRVLIDTHEE